MASSTETTVEFADGSSLSPMEAVYKIAEKMTSAEQLEVALKFLGGLKKVVGKAKTKAAKDPDAPPKAKSEGQQKWLDGCAHVREILKGANDARYKPTHAMAVASTLKTHADWPECSPATVTAAYEAYLAANPDKASVTSGGSKASSNKSKRSLKEMTEEEKKEFYKARAAKAAATKAAKKAAAAGGSSTEEVDLEDDEDDEEEAASVTPVECELEIDGKGLMKFGKVDYNGTTYVFKSDGSFLGAYNAEKKKVKKVENPFA